MAENEYKSKESNIEEVEIPNSKKERKTTKKEPKEKQERPAIANPFAGLFKNMDQKKWNTSIGSALLLLAVFLFLANFAYLFTWKVDQDRVLHKGLFEFLFDNSDRPVENWLGKFGAWTSHLLIYRWFGLASFAIPFLLFLSAIKRLMNITLLPIKSTYIRTLTLMVWSSLFLGFFADKVNFIGGAFGYYINHWLGLTLGTFGTLALIMVLLYVAISILFNPNFKALFELFARPEKDGENDENYLRPTDPGDIRVVSTIRAEEIEKTKMQRFSTLMKMHTKRRLKVNQSWKSPILSLKKI
jgi:DNA segregation ATPase FtsK/SpoIIIE, S-DNA-T family